MSRTKHGSKSPGHDYGSARPVKSSSAFGGWPSPGPYTKKLTHRTERRIGKATTRKESS